MMSHAKWAALVSGILLSMASNAFGTPRAVNESYTVTWIGVAGLCLDDGETTILIDPYISRHSLCYFLLNRDLDSDKDFISDWIDQQEISNVKAILISESHYDHVLDAPNFASLTGATLVGSSSTANVGLGAGLGSEQIDVVPFYGVRRYGKFTVEFMKSMHTPLIGNHQVDDGYITEPLKQPTDAHKYKMGGHYSFVIRHPAGNIVTHLTPFDDRRDRSWVEADIQAIFMSVGGRRNTESYLRRVVDCINPEVLYPIHCDNFFAKMPDDPSALKPWPIMGVSALAAAIERRSSPYQLKVLTAYSPVTIGGR